MYYCVFHPNEACSGCGICRGAGRECIGACESCGGDISRGDRYYRLPDGLLLCADCAEREAPRCSVCGEPLSGAFLILPELDLSLCEGCLSLARQTRGEIV